MNNFIDDSISVVSDSNITWNSTTEINYNYDGKTYSGVLGNYWSDLDTNGINQENGIWNTTYTVSGDVGNDTAPLVDPFENYLSSGFDFSETYGVSITSGSVSRSVEANVNATYTLTVENTGGVEDTYALVLMNPSTDAMLAADSVTLASGNSKTVQLNVSSDTSGNFDVTVAAVSNISAEMDSVTTTTKVEKYGVTMSADTHSAAVKPNVSGNYTVTVQNTGNIQDTFMLNVTTGNEALNITNDSLTLGPLNPGAKESSDVSLSAETPANYTATVNASSSNDPSKWTTQTLKLQVKEQDTPGVSLRIEPVTREVERDQEITYNVLVRNTGNVKDNYTITTESDATTELENASMTLSPSESANTSLNLTGLNQIKNYATTVGVASDNYDARASTNAYTQVVRAVDVSAQPGSQTTSQGNASSYTIRVKNTGTQTHDYNIAVPEKSEQTSATLADESLAGVGPGETARTTIALNNTQVLNGGSRKIAAEIKASTQNTPTKSDSTRVSSLYTQEAVYGVSVSSDVTEQAVKPGKNATYLLTVRNLGNTQDNITLSHLTSKGTLENDTFSLNASGILGDTRVVQFTHESSGEVEITANSSGVTDTLALKTRQAYVEQDNVVNSDVDDTSTVNSSTAHSSTIINSEVRNSTVNDSRITDSVIINTTVVDSDIANAEIENGVVENNTVKRGIITVDDTEYELTEDDPATPVDEIVNSDEFDSSVAGSSKETTTVTAETSNMTLEMQSNDTYVGGSFTMQRSEIPPADVEANNTDDSQYARIKPTINIEESINFLVINLSYTQRWVDNEEFDEGDLYIHRYDREEHEWVRLIEAGNPRFCNGIIRDTEKNFIVANVSKFSTYEIKPVTTDTTTEDDDSDSSGSSSSGPIASGSINLTRELDQGSTRAHISYVHANTSVTLNLESTEQANMLDRLGFTNTVAQEDVEIVAYSPAEMPDETEEPTPDVLSYAQIQIKGAENDSVKDRHVRFRIEEEALESQNGSVKHPSIMYYDDGWHEADQSTVAESDKYYTLEVSTPVFSYFAVTMGEQAPSHIVSTDLNVNISEGEAPLNVKATATIVNQGVSSGSKTIAITLDNEIIMEELVSLESGETTTLHSEVKLDEAGVYTFTAGDETATVQVSAEELEESCPACPEATDWQAVSCINGTKTRKNYRCSADTGYECTSYTETQECEQPPQTETAWPVFVGIGVLVLIIIGLLIYTWPRRSEQAIVR